MTFSIAGFCPRTGSIGAAITSSSIAVTARCLYAAAGTGVVLTQNITDPRIGPHGLHLLAEGRSAQDTLDTLRQQAHEIAFRQIAVLDRHGHGAWFSGEYALDLHTGALGERCVAAGNLLTNDAVPAAIVRAFDAALDGPLAERLIVALEAGLAAGGEHDPVRSAGLRVYGDEPFPRVDLRVDWSEDPIAALRSLWARYAPQEMDYVARAMNPREAPGFRERPSP